MKIRLCVLVSMFMITNVLASTYGIEKIEPDKYRVTTSDKMEESLRYHNEMVQSIARKYSKLHGDEWKICEISTTHRMYKWVSIVDCK